MLVHPLVVHAPIVLLPLAAIAAARERFHGTGRLGTSVDTLLILGAIGAIAAAASGQHEEASLMLSPAQIEQVREHAAMGQIVPWLSGVALLIRIRVRLQMRAGGHARSASWLGIVAFLALVGSAYAALVAGHRGALLVHRDGITRATVPERLPEPLPASESYEAESAAPR